MSVICDLQFNVVGVGSVFARLPVRPDVDSLPQQVVGSGCDRESLRSQGETYAHCAGPQPRFGNKLPNQRHYLFSVAEQTQIFLVKFNLYILLHKSKSKPKRNIPEIGLMYIYEDKFMNLIL
jgi:hypothetical protein